VEYDGREVVKNRARDREGGWILIMAGVATIGLMDRTRNALSRVCGLKRKGKFITEAILKEWLC
jgi:hypothetical protein